MVTVAQSAANWCNTHTQVDRTHYTLTSTQLQYNHHFVRTASSAITEFGIKFLFWRYLQITYTCIGWPMFVFLRQGWGVHMFLWNDVHLHNTRYCNYIQTYRIGLDWLPLASVSTDLCLRTLGFCNCTGVSNCSRTGHFGMKVIGRLCTLHFWADCVTGVFEWEWIFKRKRLTLRIAFLSSSQKLKIWARVDFLTQVFDWLCTLHFWANSVSGVFEREWIFERKCLADFAHCIFWANSVTEVFF